MMMAVMLMLMLKSIKSRGKTHLRMDVAPCCDKCTTTERTGLGSTTGRGQYRAPYGANNCQDGWVNALSKY